MILVTQAGGDDNSEFCVILIPQTVLALRGSGGIKGGLVKGSRLQGPTGHHRTRKSIEFLSFLKKMVLALEF